MNAKRLLSTCLRSRTEELARQGHVLTLRVVSVGPAKRYRVDRGGSWVEADEPPTDGARWFDTQAFDGVKGG